MSSGSIAKEMSAKKVARKHIASNFDKKTVNAKLKANFNNGKLKQSISVSLRMKKDEIIWLKGTKFITIFKAKITPTSVSYYSPYAKNYFEGDFTMLKKLLGTDINFNQLQNLLLGQSLLNVKEVKQNVTIADNSYILSPEKQAKLFNIFFTINPSHFKLDKQSIVDAEKNKRLDIIYPSYDVVDNTIFPSEIKIKAKQPNKFTNIDFILKSVVFDTNFDTNFSIPKGYKQIKL
ncbi:DUF4292 domain-containing protein [Polaribacter aquimarinus]|nr:DUF4292 domain-containing protein [Polaribacter aquimarinus]